MMDGSRLFAAPRYCPIIADGLQVVAKEGWEGRLVRPCLPPVA